MTRINCGIDPRVLTTQHLNAEAREIKRVPNQVKSGKLHVNNIPDRFTLNTGHVKFFVNKLAYLKSRYQEIRQEQIRRGFNVQDFTSAWDGVPQELMQDYTPTDRDRAIVMERLVSKDSYYKTL